MKIFILKSHYTKWPTLNLLCVNASGLHRHRQLPDCSKQAGNQRKVVNHITCSEVIAKDVVNIRSLQECPMDNVQTYGKKSKSCCLAQAVHETEFNGTTGSILENYCQVPGLFSSSFLEVIFWLPSGTGSWPRWIFSLIQSGCSYQSHVYFALQSTTIRRSCIYPLPSSCLLWKTATWIGGGLLHCNNKALCTLMNQDRPK